MSHHYGEGMPRRGRPGEPVPTQAPKRPVLIARADWVAGQRVKREREQDEEAKRLEAEKQRRAERVSWFVVNFATLVSEGQDPWAPKASAKPLKGISRMSSPITATPALPDWSGRAYLLFDGNGDDTGAFDEETARDIAVALGDWSPVVTNHLDSWVVAIPPPPRGAVSPPIPEVCGVEAWIASQRELRAQNNRFGSELRAQEASDEAKSIVALFMERTRVLDPWGTSLTLAVRYNAEKPLRPDAVGLARDVLRTNGWWAYLATDENDPRFSLEVLNPARELTPEELTRALAKEPEDGEPDPFVLKQLQEWVGLRSTALVPEIEALLASLAIFRVNLRIQVRAVEYTRLYRMELELWDSTRERVLRLLQANYGDDDVRAILERSGLHD